MVATHMVIVGWPVQVRRLLTDGAGAEVLASKYQQRGWTVTIADTRTAQGLIQGNTLDKLLNAADAAFWNSPPSLRLVPGEYEDGSPAPADITRVDVKQAYTSPATWRVETDVEGGWVAWIMREPSGAFVEAMGATTSEGYCKPHCDCSYCQVLRRQLLEEVC
jgi:hypothetical protein